MRFTIDPRPPTTEENSKPLWSKLLWFVGLYMASIVGVGGFVYAMRAILGMHG
ncbi:MAG: hypothetical protein K0R66_1707 [Gammaproteobacteria bacterium]|jgi:hypothetical protein|nr:hypothetical protein [Gammaproteobacteria bacterium]